MNRSCSTLTKLTLKIFLRIPASSCKHKHLFNGKKEAMEGNMRATSDSWYISPPLLWPSHPFSSYMLCSMAWMHAFSAQSIPIPMWDDSCFNFPWRFGSPTFPFHFDNYSLILNFIKNNNNKILVRILFYFSPVFNPFCWCMRWASFHHHYHSHHLALSVQK